MTEAEHAQITQVLNRISKEAWEAFLDSPHAKDMAVTLRAAREALRQNYQLTGPISRPAEAVVTLLGRRTLSDKVFGPWAREQLLRELPATKWRKLFAEFPLLTGVKADLLHGNMAQVGKGSQVMARYWHQGGRWAWRFCEVVGLPEESADGK